MTRINLANRNNQSLQSVSWGRAIRNNSGPLVFAAILIACSLAVGCSSEKPQPVTSNNPVPIAPLSNTMATNTAPTPLPEAKSAPKKIVHKRPATVTYTDKAYGVSFAYPRRYAIETGDAAKDLLVSNPLPMNFVQPGGVALAAVELPETGFANTDFSSALFEVSVNNALTADTCSEFSVPQPAPVKPSTEAESAPTPDAPPIKLMLGDLEMRGTEAVSGEGASQSDSKYFHVFQNRACYEFALNVTTNAAQADVALKHIDRDKVFARLSSILSTVKIAPEKVAAEKIEKDRIEKDSEKAATENLPPATPDAATAEATKSPTVDSPSPQTPEQ